MESDGYEVGWDDVYKREVSGRGSSVDNNGDLLRALRREPSWPGRLKDAESPNERVKLAFLAKVTKRCSRKRTLRSLGGSEQGNVERHGRHSVRTSHSWLLRVFSHKNEMLSVPSIGKACDATRWIC